MYQLEGRRKLWIFSVAKGTTLSSDPMFLLKSAKIHASVSPIVSSELQKKKLNYAKHHGTNDLWKNKRKNKKKQSDLVRSDKHAHARVYI